jgi:hypothetical protein
MAGKGRFRDAPQITNGPESRRFLYFFLLPNFYTYPKGWYRNGEFWVRPRPQPFWNRRVVFYVEDFKSGENAGMGQKAPFLC